MSRSNGAVLDSLYGGSSDFAFDPDILAKPAAQALYEKFSRRSRLKDAWAALTGRPTELLDLEQATADLRVRAQHFVGLREVPIAQIKGSEGRTHDFDASFAPKRSHNRQRWLGVALAWELGISLPPVELFQVEDAYFVRDGHHRISVARAQQQSHIRANVTVWEVEGALRCSPAHRRGLVPALFGIGS